MQNDSFETCEHRNRMAIHNTWFVGIRRPNCLRNSSAITWLLNWTHKRIMMSSSMEYGPCWEANSCWASQNTPPFMEPKVYYSVHKSPQPSLSWGKWFQSTTSHPTSVKSMLVLPLHSHPDSPNCLFPSRIANKILCTFLSFPMRAACPAQRSLH
jgi:hypothetical protein